MNDMNKDAMAKNLPFYLVGGCILVFLLFFASGKMKKNTNMKVNPTATDTTQTETTSNKSALEVVTPSTKMKVDGTQTLKVVLSKASVAAIDVVLMYDPALLELSGVKKSSSFPQVIQNTVDNKKGTLIYSASVDPTKEDTLAEGEVFTFMVKAKSVAKEAKLDFNTVDTIAAVNGENTLSSTKGVLLEITK